MSSYCLLLVKKNFNGIITSKIVLGWKDRFGENPRRQSNFGYLIPNEAKLNKFKRKAHLFPPTRREMLYSSSEPKKVLRFGPYFVLMGLGNILKLIPIENISMGIVL